MITLLTDFGLKDVYVGVMKGIIHGIVPNITIIDLSHQISPQDVNQASFQLGNAHPYFPKGAIHLAVVDPGVGSQRAAIAIQTERSILVGPNNGIFSHVLTQCPPQKIVELNNAKYWHSPQPSQTFHGRDIFAPAAAYLAWGIDIEELGSPLSEQDLILSHGHQSFDVPKNLGRIQAIDHFGNLITNIPVQMVAHLTSHQWGLRLSKMLIPAKANYAQVPVGETIALIGSHGWLEIAVNQGNAQEYFQAQVMDDIQLIVNDP